MIFLLQANRKVFFLVGFFFLVFLEKKNEKIKQEMKKNDNAHGIPLFIVLNFIYKPFFLIP